jgi:hypothetical protein
MRHARKAFESLLSAAVARLHHQLHVYFDTHP